MTVVFAIGALFFEILSVMIIFSYCYGENFLMDKITSLFIGVDVIYITIMYLLGWHIIMSVFMYLLLAVYCGIKYGWKWKEIVINISLTFLLLGIMQILLISIVDYLRFSKIHIELITFSENIIICVLSYCLKRAKIHELSQFIQSNSKIIGAIIGIIISLVFFVIIIYKVYKQLELNEYLFIFLYMLVLCIVLTFLQQYRIKTVEINTERECYNKYSKTYEELIDVVRMRQHEFDNQLNSIISLHYTKETYDELVEAQQEYISAIKTENRYNKLLKEGNPFFIGFLYGKFQNLSRAGIQINYKIRVDQLDKCVVPVYKLIEIANDLITNAADAMEHCEEKELYVEAVECDDEFVLEVRNTGTPLNPDYIEKCFEKGYSSKGVGRGYGLYNVRTICNSYHIDILFQNMNLDDKNWICFKIIKKNCSE